ncbi:MAG TPA: DUF3179 domain-containing (seleno)protein [Bacteroidales bacterium]
MKQYQLYSILFIVTLFFGCSKENAEKVDTHEIEIYGWLVPLDELVIYKDKLDRIKSIDHPTFNNSKDVFVDSNEEVLVYQFENQVKIYPIRAIWGNEIVNDQQGDHYFSVSYCPLTGSGVAFNRFLNDSVTTFGVSGNLFNNNLIPYDRNSGSFWSQMKLKSIKGPLGDLELQHEFLLHTIYSTAIAAYPEALILSDSAGSHECDSICLPPAVKSTVGSNFYTDNYFGVIKNDEAIVFDYKLFESGIQVFQTKFKSYSLIVAGSEEFGFAVAFINKGSENFQALNGQLPEIMTDSQGNVYDLFGKITKGPKKGQWLSAPDSYSAKKYAWELLFEKIEIFEK